MDVRFHFNFFCLRDMDCCLDLCVFFVGGSWGRSFVFNFFMGEEVTLRVHFKKFLSYFFSVLWWNFINIYSTFIRAIFFVYLGEV